MKALIASACLLLCSCSVTIRDDLLFSCSKDSDCGGNGYLCPSDGPAAGSCCLPDPETCDGYDNDCDGLADEDLESATCYDGPEGTQGRGACAPGTQSCVEGSAGACIGQVLPADEVCNQVDDDCDGAVDEGFNFQLDPANCGQCNRACMVDAGQRCVAGVCVEPPENCTDGKDNDNDGPIDCADSDCNNSGCGPGCTCLNLAKRESACNDATDNDGDGAIDCLDTDCQDQKCQATPSAFTCSGTTCACRGATSPAAETQCTNAADDDCDGMVDCQDSSCANQSCGSGCVCSGGARTETNCNDGIDNDGDARVDCAETVSCNTQSCGTGCVCAGGARTETSCNDGADNDRDGEIDCGDEDDCDDRSCGTGCFCNNGDRRENLCSDGVDNDGDAQIDCADTNCRGLTCAAGKTCSFVGTCT